MQVSFNIQLPGRPYDDAADFAARIAAILPAPIPADLSVLIDTDQTLTLSWTQAFQSPLAAASALYTFMETTYPTWLNQ